MNRHLLLAAALFVVAEVPAARAQDGPSAEDAPARVLLGAGGAVLASPSPGLAGSLGLALEAWHVLVVGEAFAGVDTSYLDFFLGGAAGAFLWSSENAPFLLGGLGYLSRGMFDTAGHDVIALTLEGGIVLARSRRAGQMWIGARAFVPISTMASFGAQYGGPPAVPSLSVNLRFWL